MLFRSGEAHMVGIAVAVSDWKGYYPIRHEGGGNMDIKREIGRASCRERV
mgnify:CR=1 FL=1